MASPGGGGPGGHGEGDGAAVAISNYKYMDHLVDRQGDCLMGAHGARSGLVLPQDGRGKRPA
jgi:hypothetical protein